MSFVERLDGWGPLQRRVLALSLLAGAALFLWVAILMPLGWLVRSQDDWRGAVRRDLARALGRATIEPALRKRLSALQTDPIWGRFYEVPQGQDTTALIQRDVVAVGTVSGVTVQAVTPIPVVEEAGLSGYGIRFTASLAADQLKKFMDGLRGNARYLRVERVTVMAPQIQRPDQNATLNVTMEVYGFTRHVVTRDRPDRERHRNSSS